MEMVYGDYLTSTPTEVMDAAYREMARPWEEMARTGGGYGRGPRPGRHRGHDHRHHHDCGCGHDHHDDCGCEEPCPRCNPDPCQCQCCIPDADLVVYGRVGETRVIPIEIENERRRDKDLELELSGWSSPGGKPTGVRTLLLNPRQITLRPCEKAEVVLVVRLGDDDQGDEAVAQPKSRTDSDDERETPDRQRIPDVDDCSVAIADLRIEGCDHRPLRIGVAVLPRSCDPYTVSCGCSCC
jgi:hypothetical protein